jgi:hypothetical protein
MRSSDDMSGVGVREERLVVTLKLRIVNYGALPSVIPVGDLTKLENMRTSAVTLRNIYSTQ